MKKDAKVGVIVPPSFCRKENKWMTYLYDGKLTVTIFSLQHQTEEDTGKSLGLHI